MIENDQLYEHLHFALLIIELEKEMLDEIGTKIWILFTIKDYNLCQVFKKLEDYILLLTSQVKGNFTALRIFQPRNMSATFGWI